MVAALPLRDASRPGVPTRGERLLVAFLVGVLVASWVAMRGTSQPAFTSDFDQVWAAARALLAGDDPYAAVGPDAPFRWKWPLYYPMPAVLLAAPLGALPVVAARCVFAALSAALFAFAVTGDGWGRLPIFASMTFIVSVDLVQWSPLMAAAFWLAPLGALVVCKPNFALPLAAGAREARAWWWMAGGAAALLAASFLAQPGWAGDWLANLRTAPHFIPPIARRGGFLVLLALLRWRRAEARWLLALALIPQAPSFYDQLLLVAVCMRWWETAILAASTWILFFHVAAQSPQPDYLAWGRLVGDATVWFCYLPMVALVLSRPNEGVLPSPVEALLRRIPRPRRA